VLHVRILDRWELVWHINAVNGMMGANASSSREKGMSTLRSAAARPLDPPVIQAHPLTFVTNDWTLVVPPQAQTMEGFREWATADDFPERVRVTYLQGEIIIDMSNEAMDDHVSPKGEITWVITSLCKQTKLGMVYVDGLLLTNPDAEVSNNPDALFFTYNSLEERRVRPVPRKGAEHKHRELEGSPDWVLEIVSDSSARKDLVRLREAYHRAGILEYWLVDARGDELLFQVLTRRKSGYVAATNRDGWQRSKVFNRSFRLERFLNDYGLWEFTLHVRED
jgi:Uma2 family endonuclease